MIRLRASSTPTAMICQRSMQPADIEVDVATTANMMGTFVHEKFAHYIVTGEYRTDRWRTEAKTQGLDSNDMEELLSNAVSMWGDAEGGLCLNHGPELWFEEGLRYDTTTPKGQPVRLTGHADIMSLPDDKTVRIDDVKSGLVRMDSLKQLLTYAVLAMKRYPDAETFVLGLIWIRHIEYNEFTFTKTEVEAFLTELLDTLDRIDSSPYVTGEHCVFCRARTSCPGWEATTTSLATTMQMSELSDGINKLATEGELGNGYLAVKQIEKLCAQFTMGVKQHIEANGPLEMANGKLLALKDAKRTVISVEKALPTLRANFDDARVASILSVTKTGIEGLAAEGARRGKASAAKRQIMEELTDAGAVSYSPYKRLSQVKRD